ncbi:MAG: hypothetical protein QM766_24100 [Burkholderiaceae bacterium]
MRNFDPAEPDGPPAEASEDAIANPIAGGVLGPPADLPMLDAFAVVCRDAAALERAATEVRALIDDPSPERIRAHLAGQVVLAESIAAAYAQAAAKAKNASDRAVLGNVALRAINVGTRAAVALAAVDTKPVRSLE